jgi:hypothetical protein
VFSKVQPFIEELRTSMADPGYLKNLESLIMKQPNALETLATRREMMKRWIAARAELAKAGYSR